MPLYCAIDWAGQSHYAVLLDAAGRILQQGAFAHTHAGIAGWLATIDALRQEQPVALIYEATKHGLIDVLLEVTWLELIPVSPVKTKMLQKLDGEARGKSDARDALLLGHYLREHYEQLRGHFIETDTAHRQLRERVDQEEALIARATEGRNRLHAQLRRLCPEWDALVEDIDHAVYRRFLLRYAPWDQPGEKTLRAFLGTHNVRGEEAVVRLIALARQARPLGTNRRFQELLLDQIRSEVRLLEAIFRELAAVEADIQTLLAALPAAPIYHSMPGVGPKLAARLADFFGSQPARRFPSKPQVLAYAGQTPLTQQSGASKSVHKRAGCARQARHICFLWARSCQVLKTTRWQREYLTVCKQRGDSVPTRYRKLGAKMLGILYRCLCSGQTYNESVFLQHRFHAPKLSPAPA